MDDRLWKPACWQLARAEEIMMNLRRREDLTHRREVMIVLFIFFDIIFGRAIVTAVET